MASASPAAAARPLRKTLRASLREAAKPGSSVPTSTGMPQAPKSSAKRAAPAPEASAGVRSPRPGTDCSSATSANAAPVGSIDRRDLLLARRARRC